MIETKGYVKQSNKSWDLLNEFQLKRETCYIVCNNCSKKECNCSNKNLQRLISAYLICG